MALLSDASELWDGACITEENSGNVVRVREAKKVRRDHFGPFMFQDSVALDNQISAIIKKMAMIDPKEILRNGCGGEIKATTVKVFDSDHEWLSSNMR